MPNKKYHEFEAGTPTSSDIILYADPTTGLLKKVALDSLIASGQYTPEVTGPVNVDTVSIVSNFTYLRVGNAVSVSGRVELNIPATGDVIFYLSVPIGTLEVGRTSGSLVKTNFSGATTQEVGCVVDDSNELVLVGIIAPIEVGDFIWTIQWTYYLAA